MTSREQSIEQGAAGTESTNEKQPVHRFNEQTFYLPKRILFQNFLILGLVDFISLLDQTSLAAALPIIGSQLAAGPLTSFVSTSYFITSTACQLLYGRVS